MVWIFLQISFWILSKLGCEREFADDKDGEVEGASSETTDEDIEKKGEDMSIPKGDSEEGEPEEVKSMYH